LLKKLGKLNIVESIKEKNYSSKEDTEQFLKILEVDFGISVNRTVLDNQLESKRQKIEELPIRTDIKLLVSYLNTNLQESFDRLKHGFEMDCWKKLAEFTLISIQIFNRRRAGEIERIHVRDFETYHTIDEEKDTDVYTILTAKERESAKQYVRFVIRGKLCRPVAVLLNKYMLRCVLMILKYRRDAGVLQDNPYLFGVPESDATVNSHKYLRACRLLNAFAVESGAQRPDLLRGTNLRKHFATVMQAFSLNDAEIGQLANFMGHNEQIHRAHYRLPAAAVDIGRITTLLEVAQSGDIEKYKGGQLQDLNGGAVNELPQYDEGIFFYI